MSERPLSRQVALGTTARPGVTSAARRRAWQRNLTGYLFILPWLFGFLAFTAIPMLGSAVLAFTDYNVLSQDIRWIGVENFRRMLFADPRYWRAVSATFTFALIAVPLKLCFALALAMLFNNARRLVYGYRAVYYAPSIVGASVAVAVPAGPHLGEGPVGALPRRGSMFDGHQGGSAPLATDGETLHQPQQRQQYWGGHADLRIGG